MSDLNTGTRWERLLAKIDGWIVADSNVATVRRVGYVALGFFLLGVLC